MVRFFDDKPIEEGDLIAASALQTMKKLYDYTQSQFDEKGLSFDLFLPEDDEPLSYKAEALTYWIRGFFVWCRFIWLRLRKF